MLTTPCVKCEHPLQMEPLIELEDADIRWFTCERCGVCGPAIITTRSLQ